MSNEKSVESVDKPAVYLDNPYIVEWQRPNRIQREGIVFPESTNGPNASTELIQFLGFESMSEDVGHYHVDASALRYHVKLAGDNLGDQRSMLGENLQQPEVPFGDTLFSGQITIYSSGIIPGTQIKGWDFVRSGRIFTTGLGINSDFDTLRHIVYGETKRSLVERIDAIIRGYEEQELERIS